MSFRQKTALVSVVALLVMYGWYFAETLQARATGTASMSGQFGFLNVAVIGVVAIQIIGTVLILIFSGERQQPMDERERDIAGRALRGAYAILLIGALGAVALALFDSQLVDIANLVLLAVVIAEIVRYGAYWWLHRRFA